MPCFLLPAPWARLPLTAPLSPRPPCEERLLLPRRRPRLRLGRRMAEMARVGSGASPEVGVPGEDDAILGGEESLGPRRGATRWATVEVALNRMSKWLVAGSFAFAVLWKRDAETMWALMGAVANSLLSQILKKILNHERPAPTLRSDPGMPSSHAQSLFYGATILVLSLFYWLGTNYLTMILGPATLVNGYLSIMVTGVAASSFSEPGYGGSCCRICLWCYMVFALAFAGAGGIRFFAVGPDCSHPRVSIILCCRCHTHHSALAQG